LLTVQRIEYIESLARALPGIQINEKTDLRQIATHLEPNPETTSTF